VEERNGPDQVGGRGVEKLIRETGMVFSRQRYGEVRDAKIRESSDPDVCICNVQLGTSREYLRRGSPGP
jgi:hypothetical protein